MFYSYNQCEASPPCFFSGFPQHTYCGSKGGPMRSFPMNTYLGDVVSKDVLKSFRNLLQSGDGTSTKKLDEDLDIL